MIWTVHAGGNKNVRAVLDGFRDAKMDFRFFTAIGVTGGEPWLRFLPASIRGELSRRKFDILPERLDCRPMRESARLIAARAGFKALTRHETGVLSVDHVWHDLDRSVARQLREARDVRGIYAYEDGALETFRIARERGVACCYDLPIAYWETSRRLLEEEAVRWPRWEPTLVGTRDSREKLERKTAEIEMADLVCCASDFVLESIPEKIRAKKKLLVAEFGSPETAAAPDRSVNSANPLRVLFAGSLTQRKGLADLFAAMKLLSRRDIELVVMGAPVLPMDFYRSEFSGFLHEPPRPHSGVLKLMAECDIFVLPSIIEGRALVQQEAMSQGLPLLITRNTGGADLIEDGRTGFLVPIRSPESLAEKIAWFADNRNAIPEMGRLARRKAAGLTWGNYGRKVAAAVMETVAAVSRKGAA
jgi:glycosyltransferase involved in cell wall biosynthesis